MISLSVSCPQLVNHIPNNDIITTKLGMVNTLRNYFCCSATPGNRIATPWLPETYQVDLLEDCLQLLTKDKEQHHQEAAVSNEPSHLWIYKPSSSNRGRGVRVVQGGGELYELLHEYHPHAIDAQGNTHTSSASQKSSSSYHSTAPGRGIIQEYLMRPLLVEGFKFDLRVYMLVACVDPFIAYYHPGYCRRTLRQYSLDPATLNDPIIHLSNTSIQVSLLLLCWTSPTYHTLYRRNRVTTKSKKKIRSTQSHATLSLPLSLCLTVFSTTSSGSIEKCTC
jgi:tubulin--tyrosine ligase like protein 10